MPFILRGNTEIVNTIRDGNYNRIFSPMRGNNTREEKLFWCLIWNALSVMHQLNSIACFSEEFLLTRKTLDSNVSFQTFLLTWKVENLIWIFWNWQQWSFVSWNNIFCTTYFQLCLLQIGCIQRWQRIMIIPFADWDDKASI